MAFTSGDMSTTVNINGTSVGLQAAVDQAMASLNALGVRMDEMSAQGESTGLAMTGFGSALSGLNGIIETATGGLVGMIEQAISFATAMAGWAIIQQAISWVQQLSDELFNLQVQTQRLDTGWRYLLGGTGGAAGVAASENMMSWTSQFSLGIPFTRQDLMSAVTTFGARQWSAQQIEQFMPYVSDLAATYGSAAYGGRGTTLQQAASAIVRAQEGISRMIKYDLNIDPAELVPYGLKMDAHGKITDPNSLIRALENFAQAKGVVGASQGITSGTWWGGWSSLVDNMQNFLLQVGGTNLNGTINPGSFFGTLQQALDSLLKWFGDHQDEIKSFADILSHLLGDVTTAGGGLLDKFVGYLDKLGVVKDIENGMTTLDDAVSALFGLNPVKYDKSHPMGHRQQLGQEYQQSGVPTWLSSMADALSKFAGMDFSGLEAFINGLIQSGPSIADTMDRMATDADRISRSITPQEQQAFDKLMQLLGGATGQMAAQVVEILFASFVGWQLIMEKMSPYLLQISAFFVGVSSFGAQIAGIVQQMAPFWQMVGQIAQAASPFKTLADAVDHLNQALKTLSGQQLPSWLRNGANWLANPFGGGSPSGSGSTGGGGFNLTSTPGGYRQFGVTGA